MKSLHNLFNKTTHAAMQQDSQVKQVISRIVPAASMAHINFCRLEAGRLRITVDNATWIAKLRFSERQIVGALRDIKLDVVTLSFHVAPAENPVKYAPAPAVNRSSNAAALALDRLAAATAQTEDEPETTHGGSAVDGRRGRIEERGDGGLSDATGDTGRGRGRGRGALSNSAGGDDQSSAQTRPSVVRQSDDRLRQELLKLAAKLREDPER